MNNLLVVLFVVLNCHAWSHGRLVAWADQLILKLERPKDWLSDLSICQSSEDALDSIRRAMKQFGIMLPDSIGDLMAGLILLRFDKGELSAEAARTHLVDVIDAYGARGVDAEAAGTLDLNDAVYAELRGQAEQTMNQLTSESLLETERSVLED